MPTKNKLETRTLTPWRESDLVKETIKKLKQKIQPRQTKPILCNPDVRLYLEALHNRFVVVAMDNFAFSC